MEGLPDPRQALSCSPSCLGGTSVDAGKGIRATVKSAILLAGKPEMAMARDLCLT